jgi:hypothetical protein
LWIVSITTAVVVLPIFNVSIAPELWASFGLIVGYLFGERAGLKVPGQADTGTNGGG